MSSSTLNGIEPSTLAVHYDISIKQYGYTWAYFSFAANICFFAMGMHAFRLARQMDKESFVLRWLIPTFSVVLFGALMLAEPVNAFTRFKEESIVWGIGFAALCLWQSTKPSRWCANSVFEYLGERSYSLYLLHPVVIILLKTRIQNLYAHLAPQLGASAYFVCALLLLVPLLLLTEAAYRLIEIPGIEFGKRITHRIRTRHITVPDARDSQQELRKHSE